MRFSFTKQQQEMRSSIAAVFREIWPGEVQRRAEAAGEIARGHCPELYRQLADHGYLALSWPKEYRGAGWSPVEMAIYYEEAGYHRLPMEIYALTTIVGSAIIALGSEEQKKFFLPRIASGHLLISIGYSEPNAGSDLASLQCRAVRDGDCYVINGVKTFNSGAHVADYCWLAARTDPEAAKHKGITVFLVDLKSAGITVRPLWNVANHCVQNEIFFQDVRVPAQNIVGGESRGWYVVVHALEIERNSTLPIGSLRRDLEELVQFCKTTTRNGALLSDDATVRQDLARFATEIEVARLIAYEVVWLQSLGKAPDALASMSKLYNSHLAQRMANASVRIAGLRGLVQSQSVWSVMGGLPEQNVRSTLAYTIAGGTSEIMRQVIALRALGLPRG